MKNTSNSPFVFDVSDPMRSGMVEHRTQTGPSPTRIGPEMIAIPEGHDVTVDATLTPLGEAIMVDATIHARLQGECVRCLKTITPDATLTVSQVFATTPDFVVGDPDDEEETEAVPLIQHDMVDLLQSVIDEAGITLPFNPVCPDGCADDAEVPGLDHLDDDSDDSEDSDDSDSGAARPIDPRWSGLEKFL